MGLPRQSVDLASISTATVNICTRSALQLSTMGGGGSHEAPPIFEALITVSDMDVRCHFL